VPVGGAGARRRRFAGCRHDPPTTLLILRLQVPIDRAEVEIEPLGVRLADRADFLYQGIATHRYLSNSSSGVHITGEA